MMPPPRYILALDTALNGCGVALLDARDGACAQEQRAMPRGHSEVLMPMVLRVLQAASVDFAQVDLIAVTVGPGAFTGLRIGLAAAQGLGLALTRPVVGVTTLAAIARDYQERTAAAEPALAVIVDTKRADFYVQFFEGAACSEPAALTGAELSERLQSRAAVCIGDGAERFLQTASVSAQWRFVAGFEQVNPGVAARLAMEKFAEAVDLAPPQPLYLRPPDVSAPKRALRTLSAQGLRDA